MEPKYEAILFISFGGPEKMEDVMPFLDNVLRGRNVPDERKKEVAHHYELFGGISPINEQNRRLIEAVDFELKSHDIRLPIYWGNRNWHPLLADTVRQMKADGVKKALAFVTAGYSSFSSCRQYRENIEQAKLDASAEDLVIDKLRVFFNHPDFVQANTDRLRQALGKFPDPARVSVAFTAHSIPSSMANSCDYESQLLETSRLVADGLGVKDWKLCFQSRSGPPTQPWLEPDILEHIKMMKDAGKQQLVIAPIGFISDHMEVVYDLDVEAKQLCDKLGINMERMKTVGRHATFVKMIRELIAERVEPGKHPLAVGTLGARSSECAKDCCPAGVRPQP